MPRSLPFLLVSGLLISGCGGGASPTAPSEPTAPPASAVGFQATLFYDEDGDGRLGAGETIRLPEVLLRVAGDTDATDQGGVASLSAPSGTQTIEADPSTLPPYYTVAALQAQVSAGAPIEVPARLAIGSNRANIAMAFGDSITNGFPLLGRHGLPRPARGRPARLLRGPP